MSAIVHHPGLDVHKESIAVSIAPPNSTEVELVALRPIRLRGAGDTTRTRRTVSPQALRRSARR